MPSKPPPEAGHSSELNIRVDNGAQAREAAAEIWALATAARDGVEPGPLVQARLQIDKALDAGLASMLLLAETPDGEPLGFAAVDVPYPSTSDQTAAEIVYLAVHPAAWRRGVCGALLRGVEDHLRRRRTPTAFLWVYDDNAAAVGAYTRAGWVPDATGRARVNPRSGRRERRHVCHIEPAILDRDPASS